MFGRALQLLAGSARRPFSALAEAVSDPFAKSGEAVRLSYEAGAPVLLKLPERQWGPSLSLEADQVEDIAGDTPERVAVVRNVFCAHSGEVMTLAQTVAAICNNAVAVASEIASPASRLMLDEYQKAEDGSYQLTGVSTDIFRLMRREGLRISLVPDVMAATTGTYNGSKGLQKGLRQSTNEVLMVAPTAFGFNAETAEDNSFMHSTEDAVREDSAALPHRRQVLREFAELHHQLTDVAGVNVSLFQHSQEHRTPDACFPNNWFSTHPRGEGSGSVPDSTLILYPMKAPSRQRERRPDILEVIRRRGYQRVLDYSAEEQSGKYFEGTGSLVIDRINGVAYVALSERAHRGLAEQWAADMGYSDLVTFHARDSEDKIVYHTNVMMAIGTDVAVVCSESVHDDRERRHLLARLSATHSIVDISKQQMGHLCGNVLELEDGRGLPVFAMSSQAHNAFTEDQRRQLRKHVAALHHAQINTIEHIGGGGVRCALAELF